MSTFIYFQLSETPLPLHTAINVFGLLLALSKPADLVKNANTNAKCLPASYIIFCI